MVGTRVRDYFRIVTTPCTMDQLAPIANIIKIVFPNFSPQIMDIFQKVEINGLLFS